MPYRYKGGFPATFPAYVDTATGQTLVAEPGEVYDMTPAQGTDFLVPPSEEGGEATTRHLPVPPDDTTWERVAAAKAKPKTTGESGE